MLVEVRPVDINKWHGKKGKDSFSQDKVIEALYDRETGGYATGLTEEEVATYEKRMGVKLDSNFDPENPHPYWSTKAAWVYLKNQTMIFNTEKPIDFIKVKLLKASKFVANSKKEYDEGRWPDATHIIFDEAEEVNIKASKIALKQQATAAVMKLDIEAKAALIQILSLKTIKGRSPNFVEVEIDNLIDTKPDELLKTISMGREEVTIRAQVLEALYKNILTKEATGIYYMGDLIALGIDEAVAWFKDVNNQRIKVAILEKLTK